MVEGSALISVAGNPGMHEAHVPCVVESCAASALARSRLTTCLRVVSVVESASHAMDMLEYQANDRDALQPTFEVVVREPKELWKPVVQSL